MKTTTLKKLVSNDRWQRWGVEASGERLVEIQTPAADSNGRKVAQRMHAAPRLEKALQRMLDEARGGRVSHGAMVDAQSALQSARGSA
jgi:hypothetical protein